MKHPAVSARSRLVAAALGSACLAVGVLGGAGCAALPELDFADVDATAPPPDGGAGPGTEGGPPALDGGGDGATGGGDSGGRRDGGGAGDAGGSADADAGAAQDAGDAGTATCSVPTGVDAGCCPTGAAPCVGVACAHCTDCAQAACAAAEYCCAKVNGSGYRGVSCVNNPAACP